MPSQNLLKFNRFLLNPTFSTVREDKSYINVQHRNQSVSFEDNYSAYFLSYSGRIGDRSGVGIGVFNQREGLIDNYGVLANYAYGIRLSPKSNFTFGANVIYYNSGFNQNLANPFESDPTLMQLENSSLFSFQPGFNLSFNNFDIGVFAENLFDYNLRTQESLTEFNQKTFTGHLQYTHQFKKSTGALGNARMLTLTRARMVGENDVVLSGNIIIDAPKLGWIQAGYDDFYGASAGIGFNIGKRVSLGYVLEKGFGTNFENFGVNHEISLAYSFAPRLTEDRVLNEDDDSGEKEVLVQHQDAENEQTLKEQLEQAFGEDESAALSLADVSATMYNEPDGNVLEQDAENTDLEPIEDDIAVAEIPNVKPGYYIIANAFKNKRNVGPFVRSLQAMGFDSDSFYNPNKGFSYVYLEHFDSLQNAREMHRSNFNGTFTEDMWILKVVRAQDLSATDTPDDKDESFSNNIFEQHGKYGHLDNQFEQGPRRSRLPHTTNYCIKPLKTYAMKT